MRLAVIIALIFLCLAGCSGKSMQGPLSPSQNQPPSADFDTVIADNAQQMLSEGRQTFRFDTFGDEDFWRGALKLHQAIAGVSPNTALSVGLKVDRDALPEETIAALQEGKVNLDDPAVTLDLLRANAVVGVAGFFDDQKQNLISLGITCAF